MWQGRVPDVRSHRRESIDPRADRVAHARLDTLAERLRDHADAETLDTALELAHVVGHGLVQARGVLVVLPGLSRQQHRCVADAPRQGPDRVQRRRERCISPYREIKP